MGTETAASIREARDRAAAELLGARTNAGIWEGELSSSALSTATAAIALALRGSPDDSELVVRGVEWIIAHQNEDGGWGDTTDSPTNISTTALCWVALGVCTRTDSVTASEARAEACLEERIGKLSPRALADAIQGVYGEDKTFALPILATCALGGRFGDGRKAWETTSPLPFELATLPQRFFSMLGLPMVSYALPALIAIGQLVHYYRGTRNPAARLMRNAARKKTLRVLHSIQPTTGGFLEATPLTSFVALSLVGIGHGDHHVAREAFRFLRASMRSDGSWPIDTNLTTWVTTLSVNGLGRALHDHLDPAERAAIAGWLLDQQYREKHPYTGAAPGGWAWTDLAGGVPDADDTSSAILALCRLTRSDDARARDAIGAGVRWLLDLQNRDGGIPTFCRGWSKLPFDRSCPDLTAHAMRAFAAARERLPADLRERAQAAAVRAASHLAATQRADGAWVPLWFGNQSEAKLENPLYGTSRVLKALGSVEGAPEAWDAALERARAWLVSAQNADGGWGGAPDLPSTIEETALAVDALAQVARTSPSTSPGTSLGTASEEIRRGAEWLVTATSNGSSFPTSPIGLYFAKLWYSERLYPLLFATTALQGACEVLET